MPLVDYLTSPFLRAPTLGALFASISAALIGVILLLRRHALIGETLSHATYPGVVIGVFIAAFVGAESLQLAILLIGALIFARIALFAIHWLEGRGGVRQDAALVFVLASFFGLGLVGATGLQKWFPAKAKDVIQLLLGEAATMGDNAIFLYGGLTLFVVLFIYLFYRPLQVWLFDPQFGRSAGVAVHWIERLFALLLPIALVSGLRSSGILLISGMLIAPAVAARCFTNRLPALFALSALFGAMSALLGVWISVESSIAWERTVPTGPVMVLVSSIFAVASLLFAPQRGLCSRLFRRWHFQMRCVEENMLKALWRAERLSWQEMSVSYPWYGRMLLWRMQNQGWVEKEFSLTLDGKKRASNLVRLHRLWELYLSSNLGFSPLDVHRNAEEIEHILTPEFEARLTHLLDNPTHDPHEQPIPERHP